MIMAFVALTKISLMYQCVCVCVYVCLWPRFLYTVLSQMLGIKVLFQVYNVNIMQVTLKRNTTATPDSVTKCRYNRHWRCFI